MRKSTNDIDTTAGNGSGGESHGTPEPETPPDGNRSADSANPGKENTTRAGRANDITLPALGFTGTLRWAWRQLTSMRTALFLLLLLAVAAVPGSLFPQRPANPAVVDQYIEDNPVAGPWLDRFQLFDVYSSVWFSAIYLLLFISLVGCVIPRAGQHAKAIRSKPPRTPRRLSRLPHYGAMAIPANRQITASQAVSEAAAVLKRRGYRVEVRNTDGPLPSVGAERGFIKEVGNLLFHMALIGVLISFAVSGLFGYRGQKILVEGGTFINNLVSYDSFDPGTNFSKGSLDPFSIQLDDFDVTFERETEANYGQPIDFKAKVTTKTTPEAQPVKQLLEVNNPLSFNGTNVYLVGNGYAPVVTVRDGEGSIALSEPVVARVNDAAYTSTIVIKAPDAQPSQLGFVGLFIPTAVKGPDGLTVASDPDPFNPQLLLDSYYGDLGLDKGVPTSVYTLDTSELSQLNGRQLDTGGIVLQANETYELPDGKGSITFEGLKRYIGVDITYDPGKYGALVFSSLAILGLMVSLFVGRRRVWVRAGTHEDGRTMVEYGLLARGEDYRLISEETTLRTLLEKKWLPENNNEDT